MGRVALVTGASGGIGGSAACLLAREGFAVALAYHTHEPEAQKLAAQLCREGLESAVFRADISDPKQVNEMVERVQKRYGFIDTLVNNAGIAGQALFTEITQEEWHRMFAVHVDGAFYCTQAVLPEMIRRKTGVIINVSSIWGMVGASCEVHYSAAKAALIGLTKALAKEVGPSGIRVNCVAPGVIDTAMSGVLDEQTLLSLREETPLGMIGSPDDAAAAIAFFASDRARFITGQVLSPNGGFVI